MNGKINEDLKTLKFIFDKNKLYIFPCVIIFVSVVLFFQFVIPQFNALLLAGEQSKNASLRLETLKRNLNILTNIKEDSLDSQLEILSLALPSEKDFSGILNSIYSSTQKTGVSLGPFSLQIGRLSGSENDEKLPKINVTLPINADINGINNFVNAISKTVPLSDVSLIRIGNSTATINLSFYYKPLGAFGSKETPLSPISQKGLSLIEELRGF